MFGFSKKPGRPTDDTDSGCAVGVDNSDTEPLVPHFGEYYIEAVQDPDTQRWWLRERKLPKEGRYSWLNEPRPIEDKKAYFFWSKVFPKYRRSLGPRFRLGLKFVNTFQAIPYAFISLAEGGFKDGFGLRLGFAWFKLSFSRFSGCTVNRFYISPTLAINGLKWEYNGWDKLVIPNEWVEVGIDQHQNGEK